ncbi:MAG: asparagine--tRNA ligase, partial [Candidatus Latescibacteria bacterium]|nr:asparagine--tRNA ligase [Candidatus Latescibacterota bacterium]
MTPDKDIQARIDRIGQFDGQTVTLKGWLYNKRSSGKLKFLQVRDGSGTIQCVVFKGNVGPAVFDAAEALTQESSVKITGTVKKDERSPIGFELDVTDLLEISRAEEYPISPKEHGTAFLMDHRHLWLRSSRQHAVLKVRAEIIRLVREFFDDNGFVLLDAPIFTPSACEGTSTLFGVDYFGEETAFLSQSGQLYMEAGAMAFGKVYCLGPTFRAEKSKTRRHLTEFWMVEPEVAYMDLAGDMELAEEFVSHVVQGVLESKRDELETLERDVSALEKVQTPFPRISYDEAIETLVEAGHEVTWGDDFGAEEETVLASRYDRPVLVHRYPKSCKAFYMKADSDRADLALCVDMLAPEGYGEIIGGGQREDDLATLVEGVNSHGLDESDFSWYLDLRRYGSVPHSGFGLGIER